jgi:hypothetical protein
MSYEGWAGGGMLAGVSSLATSQAATVNALEINVCLERKGFEPYPSKDKAVLFFEIRLKGSNCGHGQDRLVQFESRWAVIHDPEGHNVLLVQRSKPQIKAGSWIDREGDNV